jgi:hypothetical protein
VRRRGRDPEEERLTARRALADETHGLPRDHVRLVVARSLAVVAQAAVLVEREAEVVVGAGVDAAVPVVPADRDLARVALAVLVEVLADQGGVVARTLQPDRQRLALVAEGVVAPVREVVPRHSVVVRVLPGEERGPRRAAERVVHVAVRERRARAPDQLAHLGHDAHVGRALVVGGHDNDVGPLGRGRARGEREQDAEREEQALHEATAIRATVENEQ